MAVDIVRSRRRSKVALQQVAHLWERVPVLPRFSLYMIKLGNERFSTMVFIRESKRIILGPGTFSCEHNEKRWNLTLS